ncbi:Myelin and lymphocyte protein [Dissostichus eleginoides]|uniref:Myelin and lymphocyte protein n=1 Tax=Dissostichus eleginoides TaxID=100907 RepID=A0AAD9FDB1_DISEL|nr:Myelin and lymphocyte protein [Dissostichus eleginoides]
MMASNTATMGNLPRGIGICTTIPDILYLPELVFGGLVWILVACTLVVPANPQAWVMFRLLGRSRLCISRHRSLLLPQCFGGFGQSDPGDQRDDPLNSRNYKLDISAVVFSYVATLLYFIHTIFSAIRWKSF